MLHRLEGLTGTSVAVVLKAPIFAAAHFHQGITGVIAVFALALAFGAVYVRNVRNCVPLIIAHGLIDTCAMTALYLGRPGLLFGT
ncbi:MAG: CPBP family intramembrane metalloprotease [Gammaproteobacteria bacterium]|nr:MAG: CPBP family intramembrane metalloprotease [Gammaproteobacteria bacterium]